MVDSVYDSYRWVIASNSIQPSLSSFNIEGYIGVYLQYCGVEQFFLWCLVILISKCGIAVMILLTCEMQFFIISDGIKNYPPSPSTFTTPFPVSDWTFPMKLSFHDNGKLQFLVWQSEKGQYPYLFVNDKFYWPTCKWLSPILLILSN